MGQDLGQARWQSIWQTRRWPAWGLLPVAALYGLLTALRRALYRYGILSSEHLPVPVVVVGNVVVGGAGKTPTVMALVEHLQSQGWHPGVVSRGYGRKGTAPLEVQEHTPAQLSGDEPALIRRQTGAPVFVAQRRADAARALLAAHPEIDLLLCDDGLQHLALARDVSVVVFDDRGTGNGWLLPAGLLREPWPPRNNAPMGPDLVLQQSSVAPEASIKVPASRQPTDALPRFKAQRRLGIQAHNAHGQVAPLQSLAHSKLSAAAGIARPDAFFKMLAAEGLSIARTISLPDHADPALYRALLAKQDGPMLCTEKDAVKLFETIRSEPGAAPGGAEVWAVPLNLHIEPGFFSAVDALLAQRGHVPQPKTV